MEDIAEKVHNILVDSLNETEEGVLMVEGIVAKFGFSPDKISSHKEEIRALLNEMPVTFHTSTGGGWTFLNLCEDRNGCQWGEHRDMEALVVLGIAAGMASYLLPREIWPSLPGGMPYIAFNTKEDV